MYVVGEEEIEAVAEVIRSGRLFRYGVGSECDRFERRYAAWLGVEHCALTASGSYGLAAALIGLGIGPGAEVLVPAHTYMATATAVLAAGAIPVVVDIDESLTLDPAAADAAVGPHTRAVIPVHMWGTAADMDAILELARRHDLAVIEDACQGVGGGYKGRKFGTFGQAAGFSFNYYKNMTAGEGGAVVTADATVAERARCAIDPCHFYWEGRSEALKPFAGIGARPSEIMAAMLNVQLDRIDGMIAAMRGERDRILAGTRDLRSLGLEPSPLHGSDSDCGAQVLYTLPSAAAAARFVEVFPSVIAGQTGRHCYTEWDQVLLREGAAHPALNPYNLPENAACRADYGRDMCARSLEILDRTVMVATDPRHTKAEADDIIHNVGQAARVALGDLAAGDAIIRNAQPVDREKFDIDDAASASLDAEKERP
jgi:dTDP-4-amino-4,6-dideoxygalactose transaminase